MNNIEVEMLSKKDVIKILDWTEEQLDKNLDWTVPVNFRKAMAALGMKFILLYGLTYRELRKLKWNQYNEDLGQITINCYELRLPMKLNSQIKLMKAFLTQQEVNITDSYIFVDINGKQWGKTTSNSCIPDYLGNLTDNTSITSMVKYGIEQLINAGISNVIIKQITGASDELVRKYAELNNDEINYKLNTVNMYYKI